MASFHTKVVGVTSANTNGTSRQAYIARYCRTGMPVMLKREPDNPYDENAVAVFIAARAFIFITAPVQIGYLSEELAREISSHLRRGGSVNCTISEVTGGAGKKKIFGVNLELSKA